MARRSKVKQKPRVEESSGNVFADLGLANADELLAKAKLAMRISGIIEERKLTQVEAAEIFGIDQPRVSDLARGKLRRFTTDRLFRFLNALGQDVEIVVKPKLRSRKNAAVRVVEERKRRAS